MSGIFNLEYPFIYLIMKKLICVALFLLSLLSFNKETFAQFEYLGGGLSLATGGEYKYDGLPYYNKSFGIDIRTIYDYSKKIQFVPDFKFYLPNKEEFTTGGESKTTVFVLNINAHYILNSKTRNSYRLYLLGGAHIGGWNIKDNHTGALVVDVNTFKVVPGANAGAGMQFPLGSSAIFFAEVKYVIAKTNQLVFTPGIVFVL